MIRVHYFAWIEFTLDYYDYHDREFFIGIRSKCLTSVFFYRWPKLQMLRIVPPRLKPNCPQHQEGHLLDLSHKEEGLDFLGKMLSQGVTCQRPTEVHFPRCICPTWVFATMWAADGVFFWASSWSLWSPPLLPASASKKALLELE